MAYPSLESSAFAGVQRKEMAVAETPKEKRQRVAEEVEAERRRHNEAVNAQKAKGKTDK